MTLTLSAPFLDPGELRDGDLHLVLAGTFPADGRRVLVPFYRFFMHCATFRAPIGHITLRLSNDPDTVLYWGHIGYSVEPPFRGHRYAARALKLLVPLARRHQLDPLWITSNPDNIASRRTCEFAGAILEDTVDVPRDHALWPRGDHQKCRYRLATH